MALRAGQFTFPPPREIKVDNEQIGTSPEQSDISVIKVTDVRFSYDPISLPFIFDNPINIDIKMGTRMGVMGPNGAGKSTFLKLLTQRLHPVDGTITTNQHASIGYFSQHHSAEMDLNTTPMEFMMSVFPDGNVGQLRAHLAKVGIVGGLTDSRMNDLSQGLRSCVLFAKITYKCPNLLIMDEPTNFLDIETVDALISATNKYEGALLLVSHSRLFLKKCATTYLSIVPGQFNVYDDLAACERATYTFIAEMEDGDKVRIGSDNLAKHGSNAGSGSASEHVTEKSTEGIIVAC
jgi:ATPase subunit of ABC transporter with duplicated ATPase domains